MVYLPPLPPLLSLLRLIISSLFKPACRGVAELASFFRIPVITWVATDPDFNDKIAYSTLIRTLGPFSKMGQFMAEVFKQYNWRRVVMLCSNYMLYLDAARAFRRVFFEANITIAYDSSYERFPPESYISQVLIKTKQEGRSKSSWRLNTLILFLFRKITVMNCLSLKRNLFIEDEDQEWLSTYITM